MNSQKTTEISKPELTLNPFIKELQALYIVARYTVACTILSAYPAIAHATTTTGVNEKSTSQSSAVFLLYNQCAATVAGAQGTTLQTAYSVSSDVQAAMKNCMRDARDTSELNIHQAIQACLQTGTITVSTSAPTTAAASKAGSSAVSATSAVGLFRLCKRQVYSQVSALNDSASTSTSVVTSSSSSVAN